MKIRFFTLFALISLIAGTVSAQNYAFKVFGSKGNNTVNGAPIKVGTKLEESQSITVGDASYLGLANSNGKTVEISAKGTYKVKDLIAKATSSSSSLTSKYASFVINEITKEEEDAAAANRSRHMNKTGSVERTLDLVTIMLHRKTKVFGTNVHVKWYLKDQLSEREKETSRYKLIVSNFSDDELYAQVVTNMETIVDLNSKELTGQKYMIIKVIPLDKDGRDILPSRDQIVGCAIERISGDEYQKLQNDYNLFQNNQDNALAKLIEARFFEDKELYADAITAYESALKLAPDTQRYKQMYEDFMFRNVLSKEAMLEASNRANGVNKQ